MGEICRRLDGLPLAIELAAARVALLSADDLLQRLEQRLPLLASRSRDAPERQRTLRATIEWSYELLEPEEQELFRRLGVFRGSFTVEAAEAICGADLDVLESLVVKSLVRRWENGRLGMLDTIREYALELLDSAPDDAAVYLRHTEFFLAVARGANLDAARVGPGGQRLDIAMADVDNFRAALAWTIDSGPIALGFELATALEQLWVVVDPTEGARWFERLFLHPEAESLPPTLRARALRAQGSSLHIAGRPDLAEEVWNQSLAIYDRLDDESVRRRCFTGLVSAQCCEASSSRRASASREATRSTGVRTTHSGGPRRRERSAPSHVKPVTSAQRSSSSTRARRSPARRRCPGGRVEPSPSSRACLSTLE